MHVSPCRVIRAAVLPLRLASLAAAARPGSGRAARFGRMAQASTCSDPDRWSCSMFARRSTAAAPRPTPQAHIPGAVHSDYDKAGWRVTRNGVPFMLPSTRGTREADRRYSASTRTAMSSSCRPACSATDFGAAARVYWTLKVAGHPAVSILDGGFAAWQAAAYPVESGKRRAVAEDLHGRARQRLLAEPTRSSASSITRRHAGRCAPGELFRRQGEGAGRQAYGHIPGALNIDSAAFYDPATNRLRPQARACRDRRARSGRPGGGLLQHRPLGGDRLVRAVGDSWPQDVRLYDGSMVEWTADPHRPVASRAPAWTI